jgi:hypothetical protein
MLAASLTAELTSTVSDFRLRNNSDDLFVEKMLLHGDALT